MGDLKYTDNAEALLTSSINNSDDPATFSITAGAGAKFPALTGNEYFYIVAVDSSGNYEKMKVTARSTDSLTAVREIGGTSKIAFAIGDAIYLATTKEFFDEFPGIKDLQDGKPNWCGTAGGTANAITLSPSIAFTELVAGTKVSFKASANNTGAMTLNLSGLGVKSIVKQGGTALTEGLIESGGHYEVEYDGIDFHLMNYLIAQVPATKSVQIFTSSGTYTKPANLAYAIVEVIGGGGGGGGVDGQGSGTQGAAAGGGSGGYSKELIASASIGATETVTIGDGGAGGVAGANTGSSGGTTSFGSLLQATGGSGGVGDTASTAIDLVLGGSAGVGSGGDVNVAGSPGGNSIVIPASSRAISGAGGNSYLGGSGKSIGPASSSAGNNASTNSGSGGSGAATAIDTSSNFAGGNGAKGIIIVTEFY